MTVALAPTVPDVQTPKVLPQFRRAYLTALDNKSNRIEGLYICSKTGHYYVRPSIAGKRTWIKLNSSTWKAAQLEMFRLRENYQKFLAREPGALNPYARGADTTFNVSQLVDFYIASGCPKNGRRRKHASAQRPEKSREEEAAMALRLRDWFGSADVSGLGSEDLNGYYRARKAELARKRKAAGREVPEQLGDRMVERELQTLSNVIAWGIRNERKTGVKSNPVEKRDPFRDPTKIRHCREFQPANAIELHAICRAMFQERRSEVLGWQALFEAFVGQRTQEILALRTDAKTEYEPGFVSGQCLWLIRKTGEKGTFPFAHIHPALRQLIEAHARWHNARYGANSTRPSPWYFPSPENPFNPVSPGALTHRLADITALLRIGKRTSHGLRSYFVNVQRSNGMPDGEIALRIGQRGGASLIVSTYGEIVPDKLTWLPTGKDADGKPRKPAWTIFDPAPDRERTHVSAPIQTDFFAETWTQTELAF